eukprot:49015-Eustigmatos_ZCMA.PRE.1
MPHNLKCGISTGFAARTATSQQRTGLLKPTGVTDEHQYAPGQSISVPAGTHAQCYKSTTCGLIAYARNALVRLTM